MRQSGQTAKNRASVNHTAMARRMRSIANNRSKTPAATLTDEEKGAAGLGKQQRTATPRRDRKRSLTGDSHGDPCGRHQAKFDLRRLWPGPGRVPTVVPMKVPRSRSFEAAPQRSSGPKGPNRGAKFLQQLVVADRRFLTGLGGSCMGHVFQNFQGTGIPRAGALSNKRNKFDPLLLTGLGRVEVEFLVSGIGFCRRRRAHACLRESLLPLRRRTGKVKSSGRPRKGGQVHVSGSAGLAVVHVFRAGGEK